MKKSLEEEKATGGVIHISVLACLISLIGDVMVE